MRLINDNNEKQNFEFKTDISDSKCATIYVNGIEFIDCSALNSCEEDSDVDNIEDENSVKDPLDISSHKHTNREFTNYENEIVFCDKNIHDDSSEGENSVKDPPDISLHKQSNGEFTNYENEIVFCDTNIHNDNSGDENSVKYSLDIATSSKATTIADDISEDNERTIGLSRTSFGPNASRRLSVISNQEYEIHARAENFIDQLIFDLNCLNTLAHTLALCFLKLMFFFLF